MENAAHYTEITEVLPFTVKINLDISTEAPMPSDQLDLTVVTRGKNDINTVRFLTQTARFVS